MKLNYDVIESAESYINPIKDRELDLTGMYCFLINILYI